MISSKGSLNPFMSQKRLQSALLGFKRTPCDLTDEAERLIEPPSKLQRTEDYQYSPVADQANEELEPVSSTSPLLQAACWLQLANVDCNGRRAKLMGGHGASAHMLYVRCSCPDCQNRPSTLNHPSGYMSLERFCEHATAVNLADLSDDDCNEFCRSRVFVLRHDGIKVQLGDYLRELSLPLLSPLLVGRQIYLYWHDEPPGSKKGTWFSSIVVEVEPESAEVKVQYQDGSISSLFLGANFVHFGPVPPEPGERPLLSPLQPNGDLVVEGMLLRENQQHWGSINKLAKQSLDLREEMMEGQHETAEERDEREPGVHGEEQHSAGEGGWLLERLQQAVGDVGHVVGVKQEPDTISRGPLRCSLSPTSCPFSPPTAFHKTCSAQHITPAPPLPPPRCCSQSPPFLTTDPSKRNQSNNNSHAHPATGCHSGVRKVGSLKRPVSQIWQDAQLPNMEDVAMDGTHTEPGSDDIEDAIDTEGGVAASVPEAHAGTSTPPGLPTAPANSPPENQDAHELNDKSAPKSTQKEAHKNAHHAASEDPLDGCFEGRGGVDIARHLLLDLNVSGRPIHADSSSSRSGEVLRTLPSQPSSNTALVLVSSNTPPGSPPEGRARIDGQFEGKDGKAAGEWQRAVKDSTAAAGQSDTTEEDGCETEQWEVHSNSSCNLGLAFPNVLQGSTVESTSPEALEHFLLLAPLQYLAFHSRLEDLSHVQAPPPPPEVVHNPGHTPAARWGGHTASRLVVTLPSGEHQGLPKSLSMGTSPVLSPAILSMHVRTGSLSKSSNPPAAPRSGSRATASRSNPPAFSSPSRDTPALRDPYLIGQSATHAKTEPQSGLWQKWSFTLSPKVVALLSALQISHEQILQVPQQLLPELLAKLHNTADSYMSHKRPANKDMLATLRKFVLCQLVATQRQELSHLSELSDIHGSGDGSTAQHVSRSQRQSDRQVSEGSEGREGVVEQCQAARSFSPRTGHEQHGGAGPDPTDPQLLPRISITFPMPANTPPNGEHTPTHTSRSIPTCHSNSPVLRCTPNPNDSHSNSTSNEHASRSVHQSKTPPTPNNVSRHHLAASKAAYPGTHAEVLDADCEIVHENPPPHVAQHHPFIVRSQPGYPATGRRCGSGVPDSMGKQTQADDEGAHDAFSLGTIPTAATLAKTHLMLQTPGQGHDEKRHPNRALQLALMKSSDVQPSVPKTMHTSQPLDSRAGAAAVAASQERHTAVGERLLTTASSGSFPPNASALRSLLSSCSADHAALLNHPGALNALRMLMPSLSQDGSGSQWPCMSQAPERDNSRLQAPSRGPPGQQFSASQQFSAVSHADSAQVEVGNGSAERAGRHGSLAQHGASGWHIGAGQHRTLSQHPDLMRLHRARLESGLAVAAVSPRRSANGSASHYGTGGSLFSAAHSEMSPGYKHGGPPPSRGGAQRNRGEMPGYLAMQQASRSAADSKSDVHYPSIISAVSRASVPAPNAFMSSRGSQMETVNTINNVPVRSQHRVMRNEAVLALSKKMAQPARQPPDTPPLDQDPREAPVKELPVLPDTSDLAEIAKSVVTVLNMLDTPRDVRKQVLAQLRHMSVDERIIMYVDLRDACARRDYESVRDVVNELSGAA